MTSDPLAYPVYVYAIIFATAILGGLVGYFNREKNPKLWEVLVVILTSSFLGFISFCLAIANELSMPMTLVAVGVVGLMGKRSFADLQNLVRLRAGLPPDVGTPPTSGEGNQ